MKFLLVNNTLILVLAVIVGIISLLFFIAKPKMLLYTIPVIIPFRFTLISFGTVDVRLSDVIFILWIILWILLVLTRKVILKNIVTQKKIIYFMFYSIICTLIGAHNGVNSSSIMELLRFALVIITAISIITTMNDFKTISTFLCFWSIGSFISSVVNIIFVYLNGFKLQQFIGIMNANVKEFYDMKFASSTLFEDPNNYASYLILGLFISYALLKNRTNLLSSKKLKIIIFFQLVAFILTLSRGAYIGVLAAMAIAIFYSKKVTRIKVIRPVLLLIFLAVVTLSINKLFSQDISAMSRLGLWKVGLNMTFLNPIFGVGLGNFPVCFFDYIKDSLLLANPYTHNIFLKISSETGIIGLILFLNIFASSIKFSLSDYCDNNQKELFKYTTLGIIAFLIQGMSVEYFASRHLWIIVSIMLLLNDKVKHSETTDIQIE